MDAAEHEVRVAKAAALRELATEFDERIAAIPEWDTRDKAMIRARTLGEAARAARERADGLEAG